MDEKIILNDPRTSIKLKDFPVVVFCDNTRNFLSLGIRKRTNGEYSHVMFMLNPKGQCASQDFSGFRIIGIERYLKPGMRLKFFALADHNNHQDESFYKDVWKDLPWWKRRYDYLGIVGQLLGIRALNNPKINYCSEDVGKRLADHYDINDLPPHRNPSELNKIMTPDPRFKYLGHWFSD